MKNNFWFGVILTLSILISCYAFQIAYVTRGGYGIGGELFTIALPLTVVFNKILMLEAKIKRKSEYIEKLNDGESTYTATGIVATAGRTIAVDPQFIKLEFGKQTRKITILN